MKVSGIVDVNSVTEGQRSKGKALRWLKDNGKVGNRGLLSIYISKKIS